MSARNRIGVDVAIIGGGVTGLWLLNLLRARGYNTVLIERSAFGDGQTVASQGMIHGGLKYALGGALTKTSEALAAMPERWRNCLQGAGDVDLRGVNVLSDHYYLWTNDATLGQLGGFFASKLLRGRIRRLPQAEWVPPFDLHGFAGVVYELNDLVLDIASLLGHLAAAQRPYMLRGEVSPGEIRWDAKGTLAGIQIGGIEVSAQCYVLAAGAGNQDLLDVMGATGISMQRRPLQQVMVRGPGLVPLFAHCIHGLGRVEPQLTITTHTDADGRMLWYLGGKLASEGVQRSSADQIAHARRELSRCLPWLDLAHVDLETTWAERAEPQQFGRRRPDEAFVARVANVFVCWPTKLALVPDLADRLLAALDVAPSHSAISLPPTGELAVALAPWNR